MPCQDFKVLLKAFLSEQIIYLIVRDWKLPKIIM